MEAKITIVQPGVLSILSIEVYDEMIITQILVIAKASASTADCTNIESYWSTVSDWERDMRPCLNQVINGKEVFVESRIKMPLFSASETERRVQEVLLQILEIPGR
jgi:hypothetical protein